MLHWTDCAKIHEGCGGRVRWIEAIDTLGVGFHGECLYCDADRLPQEDIIPVDCFTPESITRVPRDTLAELEWCDNNYWDTNQDRLEEELDDYIDS